MKPASWLWVGWRDSFRTVHSLIPTADIISVDTVETNRFLVNPSGFGRLYSGLVLCSSFQHLPAFERGDKIFKLEQAIKSFLQECPNADVLFLSSAAVYGLRYTKRLLLETDTMGGSSSYAREKIHLEVFLRRETAARGHNLVILRPSGLFGKSQDFSRVNGLVDRLKFSSKKLEIAFLGRQLRDFLHVRDLFRVIKGMMISMGAQGEVPRHIVYNVTNGEARSVRDVCQQFIDLNVAPEISYYESEGPPHCALDGARLFAEFGYVFQKVRDF